MVAQQLYAADNRNLFMVKGAGLASCERFIAARSNKHNEYLSYGGWIDGYLSAINQLSKDTYDLAPWQSTDYLARIVENYCNAHPNKTFFEAFAATVQVLHKDRLIEESDLVTIESNGKKFLVREEILIRVQRQLASKDYFSGKANGVYDKQLTDALKKYQRSHKLKVTGLPDQATLITLFYGSQE